MRLWLPALAIWALAFGITTRTTLWDRDEPRFARAAIEMARTGDWLVPRLEGAPRTAKPPLTYWLMAASMAIAGPSAAAARCWSPLALALAGVFTALLGRRVGSAAIGMRAMWMTTLAPLPLVEGTAATTDAILLAAIAAALLAGVALVQNPRSVAAALGLFTALTAAQLTKGPVGLIVPLAVIGTVAARHGGRSDARRIWTGLALPAACSLAIFGGWLLLAANATGGQFSREFIGREVIGRALASREGHGVPWLAAPFYYPAVLAIGFLPWSLFAPAAIRRIRDGWRAHDLLTTVGVVGVVVPVVLFTLTATKLPHYVLPAFPAMAVLCAAGVSTADQFKRLLIATTAIVLLMAAVALPAVERRKPIPEAARIANATCPADCDVSLAATDEPSLIFLLDRPRVTRLDSPESIASWSRVADRGVLIARAERWDSLPDDVRGAAHEVGRVGGWDVVHGGQVTLVVVSRGDR